MGAIRYKPDHAGLGQLMRSDGVKDVLRAHAEHGADLARAISPVRTGDYEASFHVETGEVSASGRRAAAFLINDSPHAVLVEWHDNHHVLARVAGMIGRA